MKPSVKQKAKIFIHKKYSNSSLWDTMDDLTKCYLDGYEQAEYELSQELAIGFFKRFGDKYARRYDLQDRGKKK